MTCLLLSLTFRQSGSIRVSIDSAASNDPCQHRVCIRPCSADQMPITFGGPQVPSFVRAVHAVGQLANQHRICRFPAFIGFQLSVLAFAVKSRALPRQGLGLALNIHRRLSFRASSLILCWNSSYQRPSWAGLGRQTSVLSKKRELAMAAKSVTSFCSS